MATKSGIDQPLLPDRFRPWTVYSIFLTLPVSRIIWRARPVVPQRWTFVLPWFLPATCLVWLWAVSVTVREPYLDEIFHVHQAQRYCLGRFGEWDDKITTPPGLYVLSNLLFQLFKITGLDGLYGCETDSLRALSSVGLPIVAYFFLLCRHKIEALANVRCSFKPCSPYAFHSACNVFLFPLLFFFSGLYYTDVISTAVVLGAFLNHLDRVSRACSSFLSDMLTIGLGILALLMRQTNVFWVIVYMGGLEAAHAIKTLRPKSFGRPDSATVWAQLGYAVRMYSVGDVHDLPLNRAWADDALFTVISLGIATVCNPVRVLRQIWPHLTVLGAFAAFVAWNGSVVLGDNSNHVATIHLAQILYLWPLFAFFSLPLLLPYALSTLDFSRRFDLLNTPSNEETHSVSTPSMKRNADKGKDEKAGKLDPARRLLEIPSASRGYEKLRGFVSAMALLGIAVLSGLIVRYNTIIHPFTLADNRHYMFYVFRYTIRRSAWIRYLLIVPYMASGWMIWATSAMRDAWASDDTQEASRSLRRPTPWTNHPFRVRQPEATDSISATKNGKDKAQNSVEVLIADPLAYSTDPMSTWAALMLLMATSLSLVTAPLVEPRYFIVPWVMWRLQVPAWRPGRVAAGVGGRSVLGWVVRHCGRYDARLTLETAWFMAINLVTCYVFLAKPFVWRCEDGSVLDGGRLQRFIW